MLHELRGHRVHEKLLPKRAGPLSLHGAAEFAADADEVHLVPADSSSAKTGYALFLVPVAPSFELTFSFQVPSTANYYGLGFSFFDAAQHESMASYDAYSGSSSA